MKIHSEGAGIVLINGNKALIQLRDNLDTIFYPNHWAIPGGHVEKNEDPMSAAIRELKEEAGYISTNPKPIGSYTFTNPKGNLIKENSYYDLYDHKQKIDCNEGQKMEFKTVGFLEGELVYPGHLKVIKRALKQSN